MNNGLTAFVSYTFAAIASVFFISGIAILSSERGI